MASSNLPFEFHPRQTDLVPLLNSDPNQYTGFAEQRDRDLENYLANHQGGGGSSAGYYGSIGVFETSDGSGSSSDSVHVPAPGSGSAILYFATADVSSSTGSSYAGQASVLVQPDDFTSGESEWSVLDDAAPLVQFQKIAFQGVIEGNAVAGAVDLYLYVTDSGSIDPQRIQNGFITAFIVPSTALPTL